MRSCQVRLSLSTKAQMKPTISAESETRTPKARQKDSRSGRMLSLQIADLAPHPQQSGRGGSNGSENGEIGEDENDGDQSQNRNVERNQRNVPAKRVMEYQKIPPNTAAPRISTRASIMPARKRRPKGAMKIARGSACSSGAFSWASPPGFPWEDSSAAGSPKDISSDSPGRRIELHRLDSSTATGAGNPTPSSWGREAPISRSRPESLSCGDSRAWKIDRRSSGLRRSSKSSSRFSTGSASGWSRARRLRKFTTLSDNSSLQSAAGPSPGCRPAAGRSVGWKIPAWALPQEALLVPWAARARCAMTSLWAWKELPSFGGNRRALPLETTR